MGIIQPSKFQFDLLSDWFKDERNMVIISSPGTGKTMTCGIAALSRVDTQKHYPQVLFLCATHEAASLTTKMLSQLALKSDVKIGSALKHSNGKF